MVRGSLSTDCGPWLVCVLPSREEEVWSLFRLKRWLDLSSGGWTSLLCDGGAQMGRGSWSVDHGPWIVVHGL